MQPPTSRGRCPACHAVLDMTIIVPWGDGQQTLPVAPWICTQCAALGMIELATETIMLPPPDMWQVVKERNPALWQAITEVRAASTTHRRQGDT